jgi:hypothetical protein
MTQKRNTRLNAVLSEINEKLLPNGKRKVFSIKFVLKTGELVYMHRACAAGLRTNMKANDLKAVVAVNERGEDIGHITPVWIHSIIEFNSNTIVS